MKKAVIMAGGFGTRLRPLTMSIPKPMAPVANAPMVEHIINLLKEHNITDLVILLYFQPESITSYFGDGSKFGVNIQYVQAAADYGTAGAVKNAYELLKERFIIISGDVLTDFDLTKAINYHLDNQSQATLLLTRVPNPLQYGIVMTNDDGKIQRFLEKPSWGQVFSDTINTGIYILEPEVLDYIPYQKEFDFAKDLFPYMLKEQMPLYGYIAEGYWRDIGNLNEYQLGQFHALIGRVKLQIHGEHKANTWIGKNVQIAPTAQFHGEVIIGDYTKIDDYAIITDSTLGNNVEIGKGVRLNGVTLWDNVDIGDSSELTDDVVCNDTKIGARVTIEENVFIAEDCEIGDDANLKSNIKLWPKKVVEEGAILSRSLVQEEKWMRELFTDARITGTSNIEMNPEFGAKLGAAIGNALGQGVNYIVSRDAYPVSRIMKRAIVAGLMSVGVNPVDLQITSIPQTRQELKSGKYAGGLHVRRSPNAPNKSDIIIFSADGRDISLSKTKSVERFFFGEDIKRAPYQKVGDLHFQERSSEHYTDRFLKTIDMELIRDKRYKVLMDYSFGLASPIMPFILGKLGVQAMSLNNYIEALDDFHPNVEAAQEETSKAMRSLGYQLGFKVDSGAEKISVIDEKGNWYSSMRLLTIVTKLFLETNREQEPYKIAVPVVSSAEIEKVAEGHNVRIIRIKNSHSDMMEATLSDDMKFVGGAWGGFIFTDFLFASDGMFSIAKILEMLAKTNKTLAELDAELPRRYQAQGSVPCAWENKGKVMRKAIEYAEKYESQLIDGVKILDGEASTLLLPHKENASFIVISESDDENKAQDMLKEYIALVAQWRDSN